MVLGLLSVDPTLLLVVRLLGGGLGLSVLRRQRGVKLAFNIALLGVQATASSVMLRRPRRLRRPATSARVQWLCVLLAMLAADVIAAVLVTAVIALHDDPSEWRRLPAALRGLPLVVVTTSIAPDQRPRRRARPAGRRPARGAVAVVHYRPTAATCGRARATSRSRSCTPSPAPWTASLDTGERRPHRARPGPRPAARRARRADRAAATDGTAASGCACTAGTSSTTTGWTPLPDDRVVAARPAPATPVLLPGSRVDRLGRRRHRGARAARRRRDRRAAGRRQPARHPDLRRAARCGCSRRWPTTPASR